MKDSSQKNVGGAYNLSRAVLAGVLAAGCLMPGFAEAAKLVPSPGVNCTQVGNIATINNVNGDARYTESISWWHGDGEKVVKDCTINVNSITIGPAIYIYGGYYSNNNDNPPVINVNNNAVKINGTTFEHPATIHGGYSLNGTANGNSVSISDVTINSYVDLVYGGRGETEASFNSVSISGDGTFYHAVKGGYSLNGEANENSVRISVFTFIYDFFGGNSLNFTAFNNKVSISVVDGQFYGSV